MSYLPSKPQSVFSTVNNTTTPLGIGGTYTGTYESTDYPDILVSCVANVDLDYYIDLSSDGVTADVSIPYSVRGGGINYPHRLTVGPRFVRLRIENNSGTAAAFTTGNIQHGSFNDLAIGLHRIAAQDNDATIVRPTDYRIETALNLRDSSKTVQLYGVNRDVDVAASPEILGSFGTAGFAPETFTMAAAGTFTITYTNTADGSTATGARTLSITYLDANMDEVTATHTLGSTGSDTTAFTGYGINGAYVATTGGDAANGADIVIAATTGGAVQAEIPADNSVTETIAYHIPRNKNFFIDEFHSSALKLAGGGAPKVTFQIWKYDRANGIKYLIDESKLDTGIGNEIEHTLTNPIKVEAEYVLYMTIATDIDNAEVSGRLTGILHNA